MKILRQPTLPAVILTVLVLVFAIGCQPSGGGGSNTSDNGDDSNGGSDDSGSSELAQLNWTAENPSPGGYAFNDVIAAQGKFVAVGDSGVLITTTDGQSGEIVTINSDYDLQALVFNGNQYVAVGNRDNWTVDNNADAAAIFVSNDAQSWTKADPGNINELNDVTWTGNAFLAMGEAGKQATSSDGSNWTVETVATAKTIKAVHWDSALGFGAASGQNVIYSSSDTSTWTERATSSLFDFVSNGSRMVGLSNYGVIYSSTDGLAWESDASGNSIIPNVLRGADWSGTDLVISAQNGEIAVRSPGSWDDGDGLWTTTDADANGSLNNVAFLNGTYLSVGDGSAMLSSTNLSNWSKHSTDVVEGADLKAIDGNGAGVKVAVGNAGWVATSDSPTSLWSGQQLTSVAGDLNDVIWTGTQFAATGRSKASGSSITDNAIVVLTSPDGHTWNELNVDGSPLGIARIAGHEGTVAVASPTGHVAVCDTSCTEQDLNDLPRNIEWAGDRFVVVGDAGLFKTSSDGQSWTNGNIPTGNGLSAMAYGNGTLLVGQNISNTNKVFITSDFLNWETVEVTDPDWSNLRWLRYEDDHFVGGTNGFLWTSENGKQWEKTALPHQTWDGTGTASGYHIVGNDGRILKGD